MRHALLATLVTVAAAAFCLRPTSGAPQQQQQQLDDAAVEFFETKVRPVLAERCYKCHSADSEKLKGGLLVDSRGGLLAGGDNGPAIVPGDPEHSRLIEAISYQNVDLLMPPKAKLSDQEIADLTEWVKMGAPWPGGGPGGSSGASKIEAFDLEARKAAHWAWQPVRPQEPPAVAGEAWAKGPIDRFILAKLEAAGLSPAGPADRRTLIRRAYFDLIGLPPTPEQVRAFVDDTSPDAFEKVVDGLLASPHFGERWGRHWLDLVRYAESRGHEFDFDVPQAFQYRDYVIRAFNADVPYDQFVTEHIAGDLMPEPRAGPNEVNESILGTGFWFLGEWVHSPVDIRLDECERVDNQIDVMAKTFLGLTVGCARCHDHKFDAISAKDYYALAGFLHSSSYREVRFQWQRHNAGVVEQIKRLDDETRAIALRSLIDAHQPTLDRMADYLLAAGEKTRAEAKGQPAPAVPAGLDVSEVGSWASALKLAREDGLDPLHPLAVLLIEGGGDNPQAVADLVQAVVDRWRAEHARGSALPDGTSVVVDYSKPGPGDWITDGLAFGEGPAPAGRVELTQSPNHPARNVFTRGAAHSALIGDGLPGMLRTPTFTITAPTLFYRVKGSGQAFVVVDSHRTVVGPLHGSTKRTFNIDGQWAWQAHDVRGYIGQRAHIEFTASDPAKFVAVEAVLQGEAAPPEPSTVSALAIKALTEPALPQTVNELAGRYQTLFAETASLVAADRLSEGDDAIERAKLAAWMLARAERFAAISSAEKATALREPLRQYHERRAQLLAEIKDSPTAMAMLDANGVDELLLIRGSHKTPAEVVPRRLLEAIGGAEPLPVRSGSGRLELAQRIVDPSNPFTSRVMANRVWHHLFGRGIVASTDNFGVLGTPPTHPELLDHLADRFVKDGWSVKRLVRSIVLSSTYQMSSRPDPRAREQDPQNILLHHKPTRRLEAEAIRDSILAISGRLDPTLYGPSVDVYLTEFMEGRGRPNSGPIDGAGRRSIYTKIRRNFLPPMMLAFDMPSPFNTMGRRSVSNVPAQALILMNDPFVVEQAGVWARRVLAEAGMSAEQRVTRMYEQAFARPPTQQELAEALAFIEQQGREYGLDEAQRLNDERVWADLAHVLINVKEFVFVN